MAQVPVWQDNTVAPDVSPAPMVSPSLPKGLNGEAVATALSSAADELGKTAVKQKAVYDTGKVVQVSNQLDSDLLNAFNGQDGFFSKKGENAVGVTQQAQDYVSNKIKEYSGQLDDNTQRAAFAQHNQLNTYNYLRSAATHERNEYQAAQAENFKTGLALDVQTGAANYQNTSLIDNAINQSGTKIDAFGAIQGQSPDVINYEKIQQNTAIVKGAFGSAFDSGSFDTAKGILSTYKDKINPIEYQNMNLKFQKYQNKVDVMTQGDSILAQATRADGTVNYQVASNLIAHMYGTTGTVPVADKILQSGEKDLGKPYILGSDGTNATDCGQFTKQTFAANGIDLGTRTADGQYYNEEQKGNIFTDANNLQKGDLVFWHVPGNDGKWTPTDDPNGGADTAYKGVSHVGIYNGDGKVLQAGTNGVAYIDVNTYPVVGYAREQAEDNTVTKSIDIDKMNALKSYVFAKASDSARIKADQDRENKLQLSQQLDGASSLADGMQIVNDSGLPLQTKNELIGALRYKFAALQGSDPEAKADANYSTNGLYKDLNTYQELLTKQANAVDIESTTKYDNAIDRLNKHNTYVAKLQGMQYTPLLKMAEQNIEKASEQANEQTMFSQISDLANKGYNRATIEQFIKDTSAEKGYDAQYFIDNTDWAKIGTVRGGVK